MLMAVATTAAHAHTTATCFAVVLKLYHLMLVSLNSLLELYRLLCHNSSDNSYLCPMKCHLIFFSSQLKTVSKDDCGCITAVKQQKWYYLAAQAGIKVCHFAYTLIVVVPNTSLLVHNCGKC